MKNIKGAIFDMDGTLIDSLMIWEVLWERFGNKFLNGCEFRPSEEADKAVRTMTLKDAMNYLYDIYHIGNSGEELFDFTTETMRNFYSREVALKKGVKEFLEHCHQSGVKMCIASATEKALIKTALKHCDIEKYFSEIFSCADIGKGKEEPDVYLTALEYLGTEKEETYVFEDSQIAIATADKIGIRTVGIYDKYNYGQEKIQQTATEYIAEGETLEKLI